MKNTTPLINENLKTLNEDDFLNEVLFLIYQLTDDPKYSTISELIYLLGKDNLLNLCSVMGGCEIKIPTLMELKVFIGALYLYYSINLEGNSLQDSLDKLNIDPRLKNSLFKVYKEIENDCK